MNGGLPIKSGKFAKRLFVLVPDERSSLVLAREKKYGTYN
jgi:hypothetical protein